VELLHERCAGLDIGKKDLKACVRTPSRSGKRSRLQEIRTFATTTKGLLELRDWLVAEKVTLVVLEATGDYSRMASDSRPRSGVTAPNPGQSGAPDRIRRGVTA
jgi:transposase